MDHVPKWLEEFHISLEQARSWFDGLPKGKSLTRWCLENGKIPPSDFLNWAKKHYHLGVLTDRFDDFKKSNEIRKRYGNIWPDHVAPVFEWDGVLFLACLEPVDEFRPPQKSQWILAPLSMIAKLREEEMSAVDSSQFIESVPQGLNLFENLEVPAGLSLSSPASPPRSMPTNAPEGLSGSDLSFGSLTLESSDGPPAGMAHASAPPPTNFPLQPPPLPTAPPLGISMSAPINAEAPRAAGMTPPPAPPMNIAPPAPPVTTPAMAFQTASPSATPEAALDNAAVAILDELGKYFEKSMVLLFRSERLEPWKWSHNWRLDQGRSKTVDLSSPSVFRIVAETQHAYHGHIVSNPINEAFFQTWNSGLAPEFLTIVPIPVGKSLSGMLLGTTTKSKGPSLSLKIIEEIGVRAAELLLKAGPKKVA